MQSLTTLVNLVRYKLSGEKYQHNLFRVGMTLTLEPTPFLLAGDAIKTKSPMTGGDLVTSVTAVGLLNEGDVTLNRLYFNDDSSFLQLWLEADGTIAECRYFSRHDQEIPEDQEDWDVWLNDENGLIGWPQFQSLDGKLYDRRWAPGSARIEPRMLQETITSTAGTGTRDLRAMLYAAPTGLAAPAPQTEYILLSAVEQGERAWVDIHAGIDINPAGLSIA
ncbi:MAG TPA: DUF2491 family protein [Aliidongia sp.]|nr:DUF2491 family protein [Aliidongia sp.]